MPTVIAISHPMYSTDFGRIILELEDMFQHRLVVRNETFTLLIVLKVMYQSAGE